MGNRDRFRYHIHARTLTLRRDFLKWVAISSANYNLRYSRIQIRLNLAYKIYDFPGIEIISINSQKLTLCTKCTVLCSETRKAITNNTIIIAMLEVVVFLYLIVVFLYLITEEICCFQLSSIYANEYEYRKCG